MSESGPAKRKMNNVMKALEHGPTRLIFLGGLALAFVVMIVTFSMLGSSKPHGGGSAELESVPEPVAPSSHSPQQPVNTQAYDALTAESNAQRAEKAKETGGTAMPVPTVGQAPPQAAAPSVLPAEVDPAKASASGQAANGAQQQRQKAVAERYQAMAKQYDLLAKRWTDDSGRDVMSIRAPEEQSAVQGAPAAGAAAAGANASVQPAAAPDIRANDAFLGVTMSAANTDDKQPIVRAKILSGPAKGAMLMGSIEATQNAPGALVHFTLLTPPDGGASMPIDAIAIDPHTSRSSVASNVNNHTVSRLGALFFSSMLSGVGEGLMKGGQQQSVYSSGQNLVVQQSPYSTKDLLLIGLGTVGTNAAQMMQGTINRRPTVTLKDNTEIGVLFLKDVLLKPTKQLAGMP